MGTPTSLTSPLYTAEASADAGRDGSVRSSDGVLDLPLGRPPGMGGADGDGATNPEQLFAAGYAACFHSALLNVARRERIPAKGSTVTAQVSIGKVESGGFGLAVTLAVSLPGVGEEDAETLMHQAHAFCPYSRATRDNIVVEVIRRQ